MAETNEMFTIGLGEGWRDNTIFTFEGPHDSGVQHNLVTSTSPIHIPYHADDDPSDANKKEDIWSLRKLMYSYNPYNPTRAGDAWAQNVGYGQHLRGSMVTLRNLSNDNNTDDECKKARDYASTPAQVYHNP
jgi:hypothetical protein